MSEGGVIESFGKGPFKSRYLGAMKIILDGAAGNVTADGNLTDGRIKTESVADLERNTQMVEKAQEYLQIQSEKLGDLAMSLNREKGRYFSGPFF